MAKHVTQTTAFKPEMCKTIITMFAQGKTKAEFCARYNISSKTFEKWVTKFSAFKEAYEIAKVKAHAWFEELGRDHLVEQFEGEKLNTALYNRMMNTRFKVATQREIRVKNLKKAKNITERVNAIFEAVGDGELTTTEVTGLSRLLETSIKVSEFEELERRVKEIESSQQLGVKDDEFLKLEDDKNH